MRDTLRRLMVAATLLTGLAGFSAWMLPASAAPPDCRCKRVIVQDGVRCFLSSCSMIDCTYVCPVP